ncbi:MAG: hypothetical protein J6Y85_01855 [Alphaproteobacteria bacterium]|nr:hypothetical protein [Alphaproteobacteria bacterium]
MGATDNDLLAEKSYSSVMKYIRIAGSKDEVHQIRSVLRMISSAPMGREILKEIADRGEIVKISLVSKFSRGDFNFSTKARYYADDNSIEIRKGAVNLSETNKDKLLRAQIRMSRILAHELQHSADSAKNTWLLYHAANIDESVLVNVLGEAHAFFSDEQLDRELRGQYGMLGKRSFRGKEVEETVDPLPRVWRTDAVERALSGESPMFKDYMNRRRRISCQKKYPVSGFKTTMDFRRNVEYYLEKMLCADISFDEAILHVKHSIKLLPAVKAQQPNHDR